MKHILFFLFIIYSLNVVAQTTQPVSKILIKYSRGYNPFNQLGVYSRGEIFEISSVNDSIFKIDRYFKITHTTIDSVRTKKDTAEISVKHRFISKRTIESLFAQLNITKDNFNASFIKPQLKKPTRKQILDIATKLDKHDEFEKENVDDAKARIAKIQNFDKLDSFINLNRPDPNVSLVIVDAWDRLDVYLINKADTIRYIGEFHQLLAQPFSRLDRSKGIVNLQINTTIAGILPKSSILRKRLDINSLTEKYVEWYIDKVL